LFRNNGGNHRSVSNGDRKVVYLPLYFILLCLQVGESICRIWTGRSSSFSSTSSFSAFRWASPFVEYGQEGLFFPLYFILLCLQVGESICRIWTGGSSSFPSTSSFSAFRWASPLKNIDRKVVFLSLQFILLCIQVGESIVEYRQEGRFLVPLLHPSLPSGGRVHCRI
jgi:hypothetical protein